MIRVAAVLASAITTPTLAAGLCAGPVYIEESAEATADDGPDFTVSEVSSEHGPVRVYEGCCSEVTRDRQALVLRKDGQALFRTYGEAGFSGYLTTRVRRISGNDWHHQAHFFGRGLLGDDRDLKFFSRVRFGSAAEALCSADSRPERG